MAQTQLPCQAFPNKLSNSLNLFLRPVKLNKVPVEWGTLKLQDVDNPTVSIDLAIKLKTGSKIFIFK